MGEVEGSVATRGARRRWNVSKSWEGPSPLLEMRGVREVSAAVDSDKRLEFFRTSGKKTQGRKNPCCGWGESHETFTVILLVKR